MNNMLSVCILLKELMFYKLNNEKLLDMDYMLNKYSSLEQLDLLIFNTEN